MTKNKDRISTPSIVEFIFFVSLYESWLRMELSTHILSINLINLFQQIQLFRDPPWIGNMAALEPWISHPIHRSCALVKALFGFLETEQD
jgi:hypothetical protein